jgi:hypothetical protein
VVERTWNLGHAAQARLRGQVRINGELLVSSNIVVTARLDNPVGGKTEQTYAVPIGADGWFEIAGEAGSWTFWPVDRTGGGHHQLLLATVQVGAGQRLERQFELERGECRVRLLDPAGKPVAGAIVALQDPAGGTRTLLPPTDANGCASDYLESGEFTLLTTPRRLIDAKDIAPGTRARVNAAQAAAMFRIGTVRVARDGAQVEIALPAEFEK